MTTGERLKIARTEKGMTQLELANKIGASYQQISQYERDLRSPKFETLKRIADALNVHWSSLFGDTEPSVVPINTYLFGEDEDRDAELLLAFYSLNDKGQQKAMEQVKDLAKIPDYQKPKTPPEDK